MNAQALSSFLLASLSTASLFGSDVPVFPQFGISYGIRSYAEVEYRLDETLQTLAYHTSLPTMTLPTAENSRQTIVVFADSTNANRLSFSSRFDGILSLSSIVEKESERAKIESFTRTIGKEDPEWAWNPWWGRTDRTLRFSVSSGIVIFHEGDTEVHSGILAASTNGPIGLAYEMPYRFGEAVHVWAEQPADDGFLYGRMYVPLLLAPPILIGSNSFGKRVEAHIGNLMPERHDSTGGRLGIAKSAALVFYARIPTNYVHKVEKHDGVPSYRFRPDDAFDGDNLIQTVFLDDENNVLRLEIKLSDDGIGEDPEGRLPEMFRGRNRLMETGGHLPIVLQTTLRCARRDISTSETLEREGKGGLLLALTPYDLPNSGKCSVLALHGFRRYISIGGDESDMFLPVSLNQQAIFDALAEISEESGVQRIPVFLDVYAPLSALEEEPDLQDWFSENRQIASVRLGTFEREYEGQKK